MRSAPWISGVLLLCLVACGGEERKPPVGEGSAEDWARDLESSSEEVRVQAASALGWLGPEAVGARDALIDALEIPLPQVRALAASALAGLGAEAAPAVPALARRVSGETDPEARIAATRALATIGPAAGEAIPDLAIALLKGEVEVRSAAVEALGRIAPPDPAVLPLLAKALRDPSSRVKVAAANAFPAWEAAALPCLSDALDERDPATRRAAVLALGRLGPVAEPVVEKLTALCEDEYTEIQDAARQALRLILREE